MARNALLGLGMVAPDDEWRLTRAVNALGFGPMTQATRAGRQNALLSAVAPADRPNDYLAPVAETISPTMGGYGAGQMMAEGSRAIGQGDYLSGGAGLALGMAGMVPGAPKKGIRAFHGSPHDFDKFSLDKIGTGEGAQAYGHGLYFAESEGVAQSYRQALQQVDLAPFDVAGVPPKHWNAARMFAQNTDPKLPEVAARDFAQWTGSDVTPELIEAFRKAKKPGHMYEVSINADPEDFLDWDKPLSQQSEKVRRALGQQGVKAPDRNASREFDDALLAALEGDGSTTLPRQPIDPMGEDIIRQIYSRRGSTWLDPNKSAEQGASKALREAGIPGIRYLDQGSRGAGEGSRNYVVFRDDIIDIVKKYGLAAAVSTYGFDAVRGAMEDQQQ